jgi:hypothetical protein
VIGHAGEKRCNRDAPIHMYTSLSGNYVEPGRKTRLSQYSKSKSPNYRGCLQFPDSRQASDASAPERDHAYFLSIAGVATTGSQCSMNHLYSVQMHDGVYKLPLETYRHPTIHPMAVFTQGIRNPPTKLNSTRPVRGHVFPCS